MNRKLRNTVYFSCSLPYEKPAVCLLWRSMVIHRWSRTRHQFQTALSHRNCRRILHHYIQVIFFSHSLCSQVYYTYIYILHIHSLPRSTFFIVNLTKYNFQFAIVIAPANDVTASTLNSDSSYDYAFGGALDSPALPSTIKLTSPPIKLRSEGKSSFIHGIALAILHGKMEAPIIIYEIHFTFFRWCAAQLTVISGQVFMMSDIIGELSVT